ncbi:MAG TPA: gliding motility protein GldN [Arachidicoccus sp.]|nr:gliding motility protein GldN [Arachidicoccus sp.]
MKKYLIIPFLAIFTLFLSGLTAESMGQTNGQSGYIAKNDTAAIRPNFFSQGAGDSLPVELIKENGIIPKGKMPLRNDFPYQQAPYQQSNALAYPSVKQENITFNVRVWENIDTRRSANRSMMYALDDFGAHQLVTLMLSAIKEGKITAFSSEDDRFTTPLSPDQVTEAMGNGLDTSAIYDLDGNISGYQVRSKSIDLDSIYTFCIKEDWFYDQNYGKMMVRILGIAPIVSYKLSTGDIIPNSEHPIFWLYFPDFRSYMTKYKAYDVRATGTKIPFNELFDLRQFNGTMAKSDYQNPGEISWNTLMPDLNEQKETADKIWSMIDSYGKDKYHMISENQADKKRKRK